MKTISKLFVVILMMAFSKNIFAQCEMACSKTCKQESKATIKDATADTNKTAYTCPMHPEVKSAKEGKCPQCGMFLKKTDTKTKSTHYTCSMCGGDYDKKGKCKKCNMNLIEKK
ncbi:MAG TPA: heavy metal-binding domain-containing protein [Bacteroidia bacterium]